MATWDEDYWTSTIESGLPRRDRRSGAYLAYVPDQLQETPLLLPPGVDATVATAEQAVRTLAGDARDLAGIARFLLRSEAIASSRIEGIAPGVQGVALAELGTHESVPDVSAQARLVANNMTVLQDARTTLASTPAVTLGHVIDLHAALLPDEPHHHGVRSVQNWIGGSNHHPLDADFVPPAPQRVASSMNDLVAYLNGASHSPIVQAALVHAQFETIHPFTDGNGRVGRALIHTVLTRRGLTPEAVLPVSLVLSTLREDYVRGLTSYRHSDAVDSAPAHAARAAWIEVFVSAVSTAAEQAARLAVDLVSLRTEWEERLAASRARQGKVRGVRSDSATALILRDLPATPVLTSTTVQRIYGVSHVAADRALAELVDGNVLAVHGRRGVRYYQAFDVLDLITGAERRLASTRFDTRTSPPIRPVPARTDRT
ncbi:Fic family protein [Propioniciclava soli]|uniref:Fic family protein n=1 Tax=Propioniciclava soli TaxID=2775081 RepID=A0ABZ3CBF6_9ACTN